MVTEEYVAKGLHLLGCEIVGRKMYGHVVGIESWSSKILVISSSGYCCDVTKVSWYLDDETQCDYETYMKLHYPELGHIWMAQI